MYCRFLLKATKIDAREAPLATPTRGSKTHPATPPLSHSTLSHLEDPLRPGLAAGLGAVGGAAAAARAGVGPELAGHVPAAAAPHLHHHLAVVVVVVAGVAAVLLLAAHGWRPDPLGVRLHEAQRGPDAGVEQRGWAPTLPSLQYRTHDVL